jgi:hypothetical protein
MWKPLVVPVNVAGLFVLALIVIASASSSAGARKRSEPCFPRGSATEVQTSALRIYRRGRSVVACALETGSRVRLGLHSGPANDGAGVVAEIDVENSYVAYVVRDTSGVARGGAAALKLADLRAARRVDIGSTGCERGAGPSVPSFDVNPGGQLAWTCASEGASGTIVEVHKYDADGPGVLDEGSGSPSDSPIAHSVALSKFEGTVYWMHGTEPRSARLR